MMQGRNQVGGEIHLDHTGGWRSSLDHWRERLWGESVDTESPVLPLPRVHLWQSHHHLLPGVASSPISLLVPLPHSHFSLEAKWCFKNMLVRVPPMPRSPPTGPAPHSVSLLILGPKYPPLNLSSSCTSCLIYSTLNPFVSLLVLANVKCLQDLCTAIPSAQNILPQTPAWSLPHFLQPSAQYHPIRKVFPDSLYKVILLIISTCWYLFDLPADIIYF